MNVAIVCLDDEFSEKLAETIASLLGFEYVRFNDSFQIGLISSCDFPIEKSLKEMCDLEKETLKTLLARQQIVISVPNDTFLSNQNHLLFKDFLTICVEIKINEKINKNIQKLIKKYSKITIKQEKIKLNQLKNNILKSLNKN